MKLTLEPTPQIQNVDGAPARIWKGFTDQGVEVLAWIRTVQPQTHDAEKLAAFERELQELKFAYSAIDIRFVI